MLGAAEHQGRHIVHMCIFLQLVCEDFRGVWGHCEEEEGGQGRAAGVENKGEEEQKGVKKEEEEEGGREGEGMEEFMPLYRQDGQTEPPH